MQEPAENEKTARFAILVRNKKSFDSRKKLEIDSIVIQSPQLKQVLKRVLEGYPGVTATLDRLVFAAPFDPFVHRWESLTKAVDNTTDELTKSHLILLVDTLKAELEDTIRAKADFIANQVIDYEHLWTIFPPGCIVIIREHDRNCAIRFAQGSYEQTVRGKAYIMRCQNVDWDGEQMGFGEQSSEVAIWAGTKPLIELDACPLDFHPDKASITDELISRGTSFEHLRGFQYKAYLGT